MEKAFFFGSVSRIRIYLRCDCFTSDLSVSVSLSISLPPCLWDSNIGRRLAGAACNFFVGPLSSHETIHVNVSKILHRIYLDTSSGDKLFCLRQLRGLLKSEKHHTKIPARLLLLHHRIVLLSPPAPAPTSHIETALRTSVLLLLTAVCVAVSGVPVPPTDGSATTKIWLDYAFYALGMDRLVDHFEGLSSGLAAM